MDADALARNRVHPYDYKKKSSRPATIFLERGCVRSTSRSTWAGGELWDHFSTPFPLSGRCGWGVAHSRAPFGWGFAALGSSVVDSFGLRPCCAECIRGFHLC